MVGAWVCRKHSRMLVECVSGASMTRLQRSHVILGNGKLQDKHRSTLFSRAPTGGFRTSDSAVIDLVSDSENSSENNNEKDFHSNKPRVLLWKGRNEQQFDARQGWRTAPVRKPLDFVEVNGIIFRPGMSVELANNGIARIAEISEDAYGNICFKGRHLANLKDLPTLFPRWDQELCWITKVKSDGSVEDKGIPITLVRNIVRVHFTNDPWSRFGSKQQPKTYFCRLRWMCIEDSTELYVRYLDADEADEGYRVPPSVLRRHWRGETRLFGSSGSDGNRKYTFGDGFCGAGGISCGARMAGLDVKWSFDHNEAATRTYRMNFPDTICELADFDQFMTNLAEDIRVDISHSSPPCQTWSPAHTVASADDDRNSALIFSSYNLIQKVRPRIHTLEQTSGLPERYKEEYYWVVRDTLELGYSVHAKVVRADEYGVPQRRKRLIFIAAGSVDRNIIFGFLVC